MSTEDYAVPLPETDLAALADVVGDARVVCLGESTHYVAEFNRFKEHALRFLVRELGFSAFVLESGFAEGLAVHDWVLGGAGDVDELARTGLNYSFGADPRLRASLRLLRERHGDVRYYGMDVPGDCANPVRAVAACLARVPGRDGAAELLAMADLGERYGAPARFHALSEVDRATLVAGVTALAGRADGDEVAHRCARSAALVLDFLATGENPRDAFMADTVRWVLGREQRIVVSAHNGHVQRAPLFGGTTLGQHLAAELGDGLVVIGTTHGPGELLYRHVEGDTLDIRQGRVTPEPHTIDAVLHAVLHAGSTGAGPQLVRPAALPAHLRAGVTAISAENVTCELDPAVAFDALVHFDTVHPEPAQFAALRAALPG